MTRHKISVASPSIGKEEEENVLSAVRSGWISSKGPFVGQFERGFSARIGKKHGVSTSNGTTALHLALLALRVGPGDEVVVPSLTFVASANSVRYCGAKPVFADSSPDYWCADAKTILNKITKKTKAIMIVHLYGHPCEMSPITELARKRGISIVEDCAEAPGATYKGKNVGTFGDISCFSFYGNKIVTTGEGGMCLTDDEKIAGEIATLRDHGESRKCKYWYEAVGYNYRMTNVQAAIGVAQLAKMEFTIRRKREIAAQYEDRLRGRYDITTAPEMPWAKSVFWLYSVLVPGKRDRLEFRLEKEGIETRPFFHPMHMLPPYADGERLPVAERLSLQGLNLPSGPVIEDTDVEAVSSALLKELDR